DGFLFGSGFLLCRFLLWSCGFFSVLLFGFLFGSHTRSVSPVGASARRGGDWPPRCGIRLAGLKTRHYRDFRSLVAEAPHAVGEDDDDGKKDDEREGGRVIRKDVRKRVHRGVEDDYGEEVGAGSIVEPGEEDSDGDEENHADQKVIH